MFCKNCGKELESGTVFCPTCGNKIEDEAPAEFVKTDVSDNQRENKFATIGNTLGKFALIFCWTFFIPILLGEAAIALGIIGLCLKNKYPKNAELAKPALIKGIIAMVVGFVIFFIMYFVLVALITNGYLSFLESIIVTTV